MNNGLVVCEDEKLIVPEREENTEKEKKKNPAIISGCPTRLALHPRDLSNLLSGKNKKELLCARLGDVHVVSDFQSQLVKSFQWLRTVILPPTCPGSLLTVLSITHYTPVRLAF